MCVYVGLGVVGVYSSVWVCMCVCTCVFIKVSEHLGL